MKLMPDKELDQLNGVKARASEVAVRSTAKKEEKINPRLIPKSAKDYLDNLEPVEYLIENLIVKGKLYTLTARNNHGKNTLVSLLMGAVSKGANFGNLQTIQGRVLFISGENTHDAMLKLKALGLKIDLSQVDVVDLAFEMRKNANFYKDLEQAYSLVIVDSNQSYFGDGDMNANGTQLLHAQSLRELTRIKGRPAVIVLSHPIKNAERDNLIPYGGNSFTNEIDTNIMLWLDGDMATIQGGKTRQPSIVPMNFKLVVVELEDMVTNFGTPVTSTVFEFIDEAQAERASNASHDERRQILEMLKSGGATRAGLARAVINGKDDAAAQSQIQRHITKLRELKYVTQSGSYKLTRKGIEYLKNGE